MKQALPLNISKDTLIIASLCSVIILIFSVLWLFPALKQKNELHHKLPQAMAKLQEIEQIKEISRTLDEKLASVDLSFSFLNPKNEYIEFAPQQVVEDLQALAVDHNLGVSNIDPEFQSGDAKNLLQVDINAIFTGDLNSCRLLLKELLARSYVKQLHKIELQSADDGVKLAVSFPIEVK